MNELMDTYREVFEDNIKDLIITLRLCGHELKSISVVPEMSKKAKELLKEKGIEVL